MEVPVLNRITELGGDLGSLPNANFLSRIVTSFSGFEKFSPSQHFWKWSAVIIALLVTFSGIINRVKILIIIIRRRSTSSIYEPLSRSLHGAENGALVSENLRSPPFPSSESGDENELPSTSGNGQPAEESDFRVKGWGRFSDESYGNGYRYSGLRRRHCGGERDGDSFSWSCFSKDSCVVKQWGDVELKCNFDEFSGSVISVYDESKEKGICSIFSCQTELQEAAALSPTRMVVSAGKGFSGNASLKLWDTRVRRRTPVVTAKWNTPLGKLVDVYSNVEKVYLRDDGAARITVGDVRKVNSTSENYTVAEVDSWWNADANAVIVL